VDVEFGNAGDIDTNGTGWFIGFSEWAKGVPGLFGVPDSTIARSEKRIRRY